MLGVYAPEEFEQMREEQFTGTTIDAKAEAQPAASPRDKINEEIPLRSAPPPTNGNGNGGKKRTAGEFLAGLRLAIKDALKEPNPAEAIDRVVCAEEVMRMKEYLARQPVATAREELQAIITEALLAVTPPDPSDELSDVAIEGEAKMAAG
jgi:hypothetical protein